ncbi:MAG: iron ABC transporter permease [Thermoleophilaceae bacterium]|nr:iron ABC transporter permease [Thermoleophilaceae bacterium]
MTRRRPWALAVLGVAVVAVVCLPLLYLLIRVIGGGDAAWAAFGRPRTLELVVRTVGLVAAVTALSVAVGLPAAWLVSRTDLPGRKVWAVLLALPLVLPSYVVALALLAISGPGGLLGIPAIAGFDGATLALTLATYPYVFILCAAALRRADPALEEASRGLGRGPWATMRAVTLPLIAPAIGAGALLVALYALADFGVVSLMRVDVLTRAIYVEYRSLFDRTPAAVLGLVLVVLAAVVVLAEGWMSRRARGAARSSGRVAPPVPLGRWMVPALAFCGVVTGVALVLPLAVLVWWIARAPSAGDVLENIAGPAANSLLVALAAAAVTTLAAIPVAVLAVRHRGRATRALERAAYVGNALPGIVIALALVFFAARNASLLYGTLTLLIVAYLVRFFPQALAGVRSALERVDPNLEDAARGLGAPPPAVLARVTVPLMAPGLLAGAALVFLSTMKELPATLLLRPIGFDTLATEVWTTTSVSRYAEAAPPALALCVLAAPVVWLLVVRGGREWDELGGGA